MDKKVEVFSEIIGKGLMHGWCMVKNCAVEPVYI